MSGDVKGLQVKKEALEVLKQARQLISKPENWTQGAYGRDADGDVLWGRFDTAVCLCSMGAILKQGIDFNIREYVVSRLIFVMHDSVPSFNDFHSHSEVLAKFDEAIAKLEQEITPS